VPDGADQREIALIGAAKISRRSLVLEHIDAVGIEQPPDDDLADLGGADCGGGMRNTVSATDGGPGAGGIGQAAP
jgi:hypothetical protein